MEQCAKCLQPVGKDAVTLKNGTCMCPECFQLTYPAAPRETMQKPRNTHISVEAVLASLLIIGAIVGGYLFYRNQQETKRLESAEARQAEERAVPDVGVREDHRVIQGLSRVHQPFQDTPLVVAPGKIIIGHLQLEEDLDLLPLPGLPVRKPRLSSVTLAGDSLSIVAGDSFPGAS